MLSVARGVLPSSTTVMAGVGGTNPMSMFLKMLTAIERNYQTPKWRSGRDLNPRSAQTDSCFQDRCNKPLCHRSIGHDQTLCGYTQTRSIMSPSGQRPIPAIFCCRRARQGINYTSVGMAGFEPATSWSQTRRTSQAVLHPVLLAR